MKFENQTSKSLEIDESEARHHESESLRFVEFAVQFVREILLGIDLQGTKPVGSYRGPEGIYGRIDTYVQACSLV